MARILIADPDPSTRDQLCRLFEPKGFELVVLEDGQQALSHLHDGETDVLLADLQLDGIDGFGLLAEARRLHPELGVVLLAAFGSVEDAVRAMRNGAADFLSKPFSDDQVLLAVERVMEKATLLRENQDLRQALDDRLRIENFIGTDPHMQGIFKTIKAVASTRTTVLITGESGTGKTLLARAIHNLSPRRTEPFVEVNCGALPESLLESELFGHVKGAFTGATRDRPGKFEAANCGTVFLDEIGTSSPAFQIKLLRVLQDKVIERVGDTQPIPVDVRILLATNLDLEQAVADGEFREDLYYRINVVSVEMPPLRERNTDVPLLAEHFLRRFAAEHDKPVRAFSPAAMSILVHAAWPGNVRQLENVVERAVVLCEGPMIEPVDLPPNLTRTAATRDSPELLPGGGPVLPLKRALEGPEKQIILRVLELHDGNRQETAKALGINRSTLFNKMRKYGLQ